MSNKNKNKKPESRAFGGKGKEADKKKLTYKQKKIIIITAAALFVAIVAGIILAIALSSSPGEEFDFMNEDLKQYITISADDYKNYTVNSNLLKSYSEDELVAEINKILVKNKNKTALYDGAKVLSVPITLGDEVYIKYRGYIIDENGKEVDFEGGNNLSAEYTKLEIGSGSFIPGFEEGLIGKKPNQTPKLNVITSGSVEGNDIIYMSFLAMYPDGTTKSVSSERIDLSRTDLDDEYGKGFRDYIVGFANAEKPSNVHPAQTIGTSIKSKTFPYSDKGDVVYSDMKISYATRGSENEDNVVTIDAYFPLDYSKAELRGKHAKFDVYMEYAYIYDTPELDEKFIKETLKLTDEALASYEGADIVEKYKNSLREEIKAEIEESNKAVIEEKMWEHFKSKVTVIKYPEDVVQTYYDTAYAELESFYSQYSSYYSSIDECATTYFDLKAGEDWQAHIKTLAQESTLEKLLFYYIMREENLIPEGEDFEKAYNEVLEAHYDYHIEQSASELAGLEGAEYDKKIEEIRDQVLAYYGEDYFTEAAYYEYAIEKMVGFATIK